ncbi:MurR/RpiR family transcriptional regulator [Acidobacteriota bacterium]
MVNTKSIKELKEEIEKSLENISRMQKKLAAFLIDHWNEIPLLSIEYISKETGVSTASITRFTRKFGFKGFFDFKARIKEEIKNNIDPVERFRLIKEDLSGRKSLLRVAKQDVKNINKLLAQIKEENFSNLVSAVEAAKRVFTFGVSISSIFARLIRYIFNQVQKETHCLDESSVTVEEKILSVKKEDLIIFLSFLPYSKSSIDFAQLAFEQGLKVVAISDNEFSPISEYASLVLPIPRENVLFTTSVSAFSVLINAVATEIALKKKDALSDSIKDMDKILKRFYYFN